MSKQQTYDYLREIGCCPLCCLRFFNGRADDYLNVQKSLESRDIKTANTTAAAAAADADATDATDAKRVKPNVCIACLDIFSDATQAETMRQILALPALAEYDVPTVLSSFSLPISLSLRGLAIWIALIKRFPGQFSWSEPPDVPLKEVIKLLFNPQLCDRLGKPFEPNQNGMMINVFYEHDDSAEEVRKLIEVNPKLFKNRSMAPRKFNNEFLTRNAFDRNFTPDKIDIDLFAEHVPVPASSPGAAIRLDRITILGPTVFVAGRYRKMCRELCQSPWILKGVRVMEGSVSELIVAEVAPHFGVPAGTAVFSSSGREDVDVRCLGKGRPFAVEIPDARRLVLPVDVAARMERAVDKSEKVSMRHVQMVSRDDLKHIKTGEENKRKIYRALCMLREPATVDTLRRLNIPDGFQIEQLTPLRVLHRRPLLTRPRRIFSVHAHVHRDNACMVILDIVTQAGTYVKELVHGEFGRTSPSISSTIGQWIDIVALDVMAIELDWPHEVDNLGELNGESGDKPTAAAAVAT